MRSYLKYLLMSLVCCMSLLIGMDKVSAKGSFYSSISHLFQVETELVRVVENNHVVLLDSAKKAHIVTADGNSRSFFSSWFFQPFRAQQSQVISSSKLLSNVKVFPNPTVESINLSFRLSKRSEITIKVMDALGNEMMLLLNQTLDSGNQSHNFDIQGKLTSGVYFVRLSSGTETVVKRISVL